MTKTLHSSENTPLLHLLPSSNTSNGNTNNTPIPSNDSTSSKKLTTHDDHHNKNVHDAESPPPPTSSSHTITTDTDVTPTWKDMFSKVTHFIIPKDTKHLLYAIIALLTTLLSKIINILPPLYIKHAVDLLTNTNTTIATPRAIITTLLTYLSIQSASLLTSAIQSTTQQTVSLESERQFANHAFAHLHSLSLSYHLSRHVGDITRILNRGTDAISTIINTILFFILPTLFEVGIVSVVFGALMGTPVVAFTTIIAVVFYLAFTILMTSWRVEKRRVVIEASDAVGGKETETLVNYETVNLFGRTDYEVECYDQLRTVYKEARVGMVGLFALIQAGQGFLKSGGVTVGLIVAGLCAVKGEMTAGSFVAVQIYINQLFAPLTALGWQYRQIVNAFTDLEKVVMMLNRVPEVKDRVGAVVWEKRDGGEGGDDDLGEVVFENVTFRYKTSRSKAIALGGSLDSRSGSLWGGRGGGRRRGWHGGMGGGGGWRFRGGGGSWWDNKNKNDNKKTNDKSCTNDNGDNTNDTNSTPIVRGGISNITLHIPPGQTYALVGKSGSGKTTLIRLLLRLYDPDEGSIKIDGRDVRDVTMASLRDNIGVVAQDTILFNATLRENIVYGKPEATDEEVWDAVRVAALEPFILSLPDQLSTLVGERGMKLSGGERQRVGLARCIIKNPSLILLDEATSALDSGTEKEVQRGLAAICSNRTTIMIAHRLSTARMADKIVVLDEGGIVECGSHEELLGKGEGGWYKKMWEDQNDVVI